MSLKNHTMTEMAVSDGLCFSIICRNFTKVIKKIIYIISIEKYL